jgi:UDP-N-acetylmuramyl tripeptide synthase
LPIPGLPELFARVGTLVVVTGTNGKSTTAHLVEQILARAGKLPVRNRDGANLVPGITATLSRSPLLSHRPVVLEIDEGSLPLVIAPARPAVLVVTNVFRDQLSRHGEMDVVASGIRRAVTLTPRDCTIVANADDPTVADIATRSGRRVVSFGLGVPGRAEEPGPSADSVLCPRCDQPLTFMRACLSHLGDYHCPSCSFARPAPDLAATALDLEGVQGGFFRVGDLEVRLSLVGIHAVYNALAAMAVARLLGIPDAVSVAALAAARPMPGRSEWITYRGRRVFLGLVKNPAGFEALATALRPGCGRRWMLLLLNDRRADSSDVSWIWDADFDMFVGDRVWVGGSRAEALALRLKYAGADVAAPPVRHHGRALETAIAEVPEDQPLYVLLNYSAMLDLFGYLGKALAP